MMKYQFLFVFLLGYFAGFSQVTDDNWYILDSKGREFGNPLTYSTFNIQNKFKIIGANAPGILNTDGTPLKRIFAIYNNGKFLIKDFDQYTWNDTGDKDFMIGSSGLLFAPEFLYVTNIYQGDDPPQAKVENSTVIIPNNLFDDATVSTPVMRTNQDIVRNEDLTLIIPANYFDTCKGPNNGNPNINLVIGQAIDNNLISHSILKLNKIFPLPTPYSYHNISSAVLNNDANDYVLSINNIPPPLFGSYHFINFNAAFAYNHELIEKKVLITAQCVNNLAVEPWTIYETIRDLHDPNKIEVKCVFKKRKCLIFGSYRYYVKYLVEFFNDGPTLADWVDVVLTMPSCALVNTITLDKWSFGGEDGCDTIDNDYFFEIDNQKITFHLSRLSGSSLAAQSVSNPPSDAQYGRFEFCIEVDQDPSNIATILQPSQPTTSFQGTVFPIYNYIDPIVTVPDSTEMRTFRSFKNCNCECELRNPLPSIGGQQR